MKLIHIQIVILNYLCILSTSAQDILKHCHGIQEYLSSYACESYDDWVLVFEDEFIGTDYNHDVWENCFPWGRNLYCDDRADYFTDDENIEVSNGMLKFIAEEEQIIANIVDWKDWDDTLVCDGEPWGINQQTFDYRSGMIFSKRKFVYGKFEIKCKIPTIERLWPAFWLYGSCAQEIDIFEFLSTDSDPEKAGKEMTFSIHGKYECDGERKVCRKKINSSTNMSNSWHVYSIIWDDQTITWYVDGTPVLIKYKWNTILGQDILLCDPITAQNYVRDRIWPSEEIPMWVSAGLGVRHYSTATFPTEMEIDYIKIYQRINSNSSVSVCSNSDILGSTIVGQEVYVGGSNCNISISEGDFLDIVAKEKIVINSNFSVRTGAYFIMRIDN